MHGIGRGSAILPQCCRRYVYRIYYISSFIRETRSSSNIRCSSMPTIMRQYAQQCDGFNEFILNALLVLVQSDHKNGWRSI
eukprot:6177526-Pleurochrysis_carterae.AAC.1